MTSTQKKPAKKKHQHHHHHGDDCGCGHDHSKTVVRQTPKVGRNDKCPCGSGRKYKKCCLNSD